jgi:hypothetical protein
MAYEKQTWQARERQYLNRKLLVPTGTPNEYDETQVEGIVSVDGTPFSVSRLNHIEEGIYDLSLIVDSIPPKSDSYIAWVTNANTGSLDAAFGKLNEDKILFIGSQLAMYAWYKGVSKSSFPFANLQLQSTLSNVVNNLGSLSEVLSEGIHIQALMNSSPYAQTVLSNAIITNGGGALAQIAGIANASNFTSLASLYADTTAMLSVLNNQTCVNAIFGNTYMTQQLISTPSASVALYQRDKALNKAVKSTTAKVSLLSNISDFNLTTNYNNMIATLDSSGLFTKTVANGSMNGTNWAYVGSYGASNPVFTNIKSMVDGTSSSFWGTLKHGYDSTTEIAHPAFPTNTGTGTTLVNKFGIGGAVINANANASLTYSADYYTAI